MDAKTTAHEVEVMKMTITPEIASEWLTQNAGNRKHNSRTVDQYARDMQSGNWKVTGDSIKRNGTRLLDGQHRLMACIKSGVPFVTFVAFGVLEEAHAAIDGGKKRTMADELRWRGVGDPATAAAVLSLLWRWRSRVLLSPVQPTKAELLNLWDKEHEIIGDAINGARRLYTATRIPTTSTGAVYAEVATVDPTIAQEWIEYFVKGTGYVEGDSALALRNYSVRVRAQRAVRPTQTEWLAVTIKAFNAWADGTPMKLAKWARLGRGREAFPSLRIGSVEEDSDA